MFKSVVNAIRGRGGEPETAAESAPTDTDRSTGEATDTGREQDIEARMDRLDAFIELTKAPTPDAKAAILLTRLEAGDEVSASDLRSTLGDRRISAQASSDLTHAALQNESTRPLMERYAQERIILRLAGTDNVDLVVYADDPNAIQEHLKTGKAPRIDKAEANAIVDALKNNEPISPAETIKLIDYVRANPEDKIDFASLAGAVDEVRSFGLEFLTRERMNQMSPAERAGVQKAMIAKVIDFGIGELEASAKDPVRILAPRNLNLPHVANLALGAEGNEVLEARLMQVLRDSSSYSNQMAEALGVSKDEFREKTTFSEMLEKLKGIRAEAEQEAE